MRKLGIPEEYIRMTKILFQDAQVLMEGCQTVFLLGEGLDSDAPTGSVPFSFCRRGSSFGIHESFAGGNTSRYIAPRGVKATTPGPIYDTNYTLLSTRDNMVAIPRLLELFAQATGLTTNWDKSTAYFFGSGQPLAWMQEFTCPWAILGHLGKLFGLPFGIDVHTADIDQFLVDKIEKKLSYWTTLKLSLAARSVVVNAVLLSTLWFFVSLWRGSLQVTRKIKSCLMNFLWSGSSHRTRVRVSWTDCYAHKHQGGLGLQWALTYKFCAPKGYLIWNRIILAWKKFAKKVEMTAPG